MTLRRRTLPFFGALLCSTFVTCVLDSDPVLPPIPPGHDMVYVAGGVAGADDIYLLTATGEEGNLTQHIAHDSWPSWAPTGNSLAFQSDRDKVTSSEIYIMTGVGLPTQSLLRLTNDTAHQDAQPAWSPLGNRIAFVSTRDSMGLDIYLMNPVGGDSVRLTTDSANSAQPGWSPTGDRIVFVSDRSGNADIWVMDTLGGNAVNLTSDQFIDLSPAWSPDGTRIAFHSNRDTVDFAIWVMNADGSNPVKVSPNAPPCELPHWTPDSQRLAFDCDGDVYTSSADGTNLQQITRTTNQQRLESRPRWRPTTP